MWSEPTSVRYVADYKLEVTFSDGLRATINFAQRIADLGGIGSQLKDTSVFRQVSVDRELGTLVWSNGFDICPNLLYSLASATPVEQGSSYRQAG